MSELKSTTTLISSVRKEADALVAAITGEIDLSSSPELRAALFELVDKSSAARVILNLDKVSYMDSSAIAVLVELLRKMGKGKVFLTNLQKRVRDLLEIARLSTIFTIMDTEKDALAK